MKWPIVLSTKYLVISTELFTTSCDISSSASRTGEGWIFEDQVFGIGVFDNAAIAHSIKPGLLLKFSKQWIGVGRNLRREGCKSPCFRFHLEQLQQERQEL